MEEISDQDDPKFLKFPPSPNNEILIDVASLSPNASSAHDDFCNSSFSDSSTPTHPPSTQKSQSLEDSLPIPPEPSLTSDFCSSVSAKTRHFLTKFRSSYDTAKLDQLRSWMKPSRWSEIDDNLVLFLSTAPLDLALSTLQQLRNEPLFLRKISSRSLELDTEIRMESGSSVLTKALVDSGATSCYVNESFVKKFNLPTTEIYVKPPKQSRKNFSVVNEPDNTEPSDFSPDDAMEEWHRALLDELTDEDESLLILDPSDFYEERENIRVFNFIDDNLFVH
ncbi:hypothetical protein CVT24_000322, partial [Panaeolus cyanescens]